MRPGEHIGRFRLLERVALGGMAEVWSAVDEARGSTLVALKVIRREWAADEDSVAMFEDEVALTTRLRHENIVEVFGGERIDGFLVQVMELLEGSDLRQVQVRLKKRGWRFPVPLAAFVGRSVARALAYAHMKRGPRGEALDIIHRDVSPHNVMLTRDGRVKLLDFGIAKASRRLVQTTGYVVKGKTAYMAPEQVVAAPLDHRVDIFATGIVLWEVLAQRRLFKGASDQETMENVIRCDVPRLDGFRSEVPTELADLVQHLLARRPEDRPRSMVEVERAFQRLLVRSFPSNTFGTDALAAWLARVYPSALRQGTARVTPLSVPREGPGAQHEDPTLLDSAPLDSASDARPDEET